MEKQITADCFNNDEPLRHRNVRKSSVFGHSALAGFDFVLAGPEGVDEPEEPDPNPVLIGTLTGPATTGDWPWPRANFR